MARYEQDGDMFDAVIFSHFTSESATIHDWHLEICDDEVWTERSQCLKCSFAVCRHGNGIAVW